MSLSTYGTFFDAIEKAEEYLKDVDEVSFVRSTLVQDGVIRQIEIIGEATKRVVCGSPRSLSAHSVERHRRNAGQTHPRLFGVDIEKVWLTAKDDLPSLKTEIEQIVAELSRSM